MKHFVTGYFRKGLTRVINDPIELTRNYVSSGSEDIYYETAGRGEAIVLCHGLGGNHATWFQQVPALARYYHVIIWDQRGFGRSTNRNGAIGPVVAITDLKILMDHLNISQAHFVGQSMGGWTIVGFALAYPERVKSLVLSDSFGGIYTPEIEQDIDEVLKMAADAHIPDLHFLGQHPAIGKTLSQHDIVRAYLYQQIGSFGAPPSASTIYNLLRLTSYPYTDLRALKLPILFVVGSEDPINPPTWIHHVVEALSTGIVIEIPEAGHSPYFEKPTYWNEAVLKFLSTVKASI